MNRIPPVWAWTRRMRRNRSLSGAGRKFYRTCGAVVGVRFVIMGAVADEPDDSRFGPIEEMGGSPKTFADRRTHQLEDGAGLNFSQKTLDRDRLDDVRLYPHPLETR